jgi:deoxyribodipyrimidine photo-lyase
MSKRTAYSRSELGHPSPKRAKKVDEDPPYDKLVSALDSQSEQEDVTKVVHWFRGKDLRMQDNTALHHASELAQSSNVPLICVYVYCPSEESWHGTSPARIDFMIEGIKILQKELKDLNIPLVFLSAEKRDEYVSVFEKFVEEHSISHVFANYEYEVGT